MATNSSSSIVVVQASNSISNLIPTLLKVVHQLPIKLNATNYFLWKVRLLPLLHNYNLAGHMDGTVAAPASTINDQPNLAYLAWFRHDQLVFSWVIGSISEAFVPQIVGEKLHLRHSKN